MDDMMNQHGCATGATQANRGTEQNSGAEAYQAHMDQVLHDIDSVIDDMFIIDGHNSVRANNSPTTYDTDSMHPTTYDIRGIHSPTTVCTTAIEKEYHDTEEQQCMLDEELAEEEAIRLEGEMQYLQEQSPFNQEDNNAYAELHEEEAALELLKEEAALKPT